MPIDHLADLDLPPSLAALLRSIHGDSEAARRAALAPWPDLGFRSAVQERVLFAPGARDDAPARQSLERMLRLEPERFAPDKPFFAAPGTSGALRSPFPELSDAEYWCFVDLWRGEDEAHRQLTSPYRVLGDRSGIEFLRRFRRKGLRGWFARRLAGLRLDPLTEVYQWHARSCFGVYA